VIHFILGGARSGKSSLAEKHALSLYHEGAESALYYLATATPSKANLMQDFVVKHESEQAQESLEAKSLKEKPLKEKPLEERLLEEKRLANDSMLARISHHQSQRNRQFITLEEPVDLLTALSRCQAGDTVLIDCLTLWLSNCFMLAYDETKDELVLDSWLTRKAEFLAALKTSSLNFIIVSNEVGQGIIPLGHLSRHFVDESGRLHQAVAAIADKVSFVTAGLEQRLK